jgi:hypothetical protein
MFPSPWSLAVANTPEGIAVYRLDATGVEHLGAFRSAAAAWKAVDLFDTLPPSVPEAAD